MDERISRVLEKMKEKGMMVMERRKKFENYRSK